MKKVLKWIKSSSLTVKWTIASASVIFITFTVFSLIQYLSIKDWMLTEEKVSVTQTLNELSVFYQQRGPVITKGEIVESETLIQQIIDRKQAVVIFNSRGQLFLNISSTSISPSELPEIPLSKEKNVQLIEVNSDPYYIGTGPIISNNFNGYMVLISPLARYEKMMANLLWLTVGLGILALLISALVGYFLAKRFSRPVKDLKYTIKRIERNGLQERVETLPSQDELGELLILFNRMMEKVESSFDQQQQFVEDASHELRTPLQIIEGHLRLLQRWGKNDPKVLEESLFSSLEELQRLKELVEDLLALTKQDDKREEYYATDIVDIINRVMDDFHVLYPSFSFTVDKESKQYLTDISPRHFEQLLIILLDNAVKYSEQRKDIVITIKQNSGKVLILIKDFGMGIPANDIPKVFHRFYRTDKSRSRERGGNGLGLAIAKRIISRYSGEIHISSEENKGTEVLIKLNEGKS
ncbi:ATP-binding protein [Bacillus spongiae]|uniref:Signal transduction histidine-protein kinase ArlS n=1 Tax=Bacillus spongiae TaxID=2683610 RepID=A0ABU8HI85_9BACI